MNGGTHTFAGAVIKFLVSWAVEKLLALAFTGVIIELLTFRAVMNIDALALTCAIIKPLTFWTITNFFALALTCVVVELLTFQAVTNIDALAFTEVCIEPLTLWAVASWTHALAVIKVKILTCKWQSNHYNKWQCSFFCSIAHRLDRTDNRNSQYTYLLPSARKL